MNHLYFKILFYGILPGLFFLNPEISSSQHLSKQNDRYDLVSNIKKVELTHRRIDKLKDQISHSREVKNKKDLKLHHEKLVIEKKNLKKDFRFARDQESHYMKNKSEKINQLEAELKASDQRYEMIRSQIKKDLAKKNDFALQKDAEQLLKALQEKNDISTQLSMEKSDLIATTGAVDEAWKKVKHTEPAVKTERAQNSSLTTK